jgi:acetolactate synthase-1/2/3 large subunit
MYSASTALLEALHEAGVAFIFANFGSDHPALIEALAEARANGRPIPSVITCPNEMVALSCAHGYAQLTGRAQAVIVHVECGTQALGGAVHNAAKGRVPVLIFAGMSPVTQEGELRGSRNEFIHWLQDVPDQRGIVRQYMKYDHEIRSGRNVKQIVHRAMQFAHSDPKGPVYLVGARETMEEETTPVKIDPSRWQPVEPAPLPADGVDTLVKALVAADRPLVVTSYLGRNPDAVDELVRFCHSAGVGVLESAPSFMNFPHDDPFYLGNQWNEPFQNPALADADLVLVIDSDVPWIGTVNRPNDDAPIYHVDIDPLKASTTLWYIGARHSFGADAATALRQLNGELEARPAEAGALAARTRHWAKFHEDRLHELKRRETDVNGKITPEFLTACIRRQIGDDAIVLSEGITNYPAICNHVARRSAGTYFASGGSSLGWSGGAAIGMKLAEPDRTIVSLTGDGSYMFSIPSTVHWMARQYRTPFLQVVYNNRGWKAPRFSALAVHPSGYASRSNDLGLRFDPPPDYAGIAAAAGGAHAQKITQAEEVEPAVAEGLRVVREEGRCAVIDAWLAES